MATADLDELMALNDQLLALNEAGVPIDVGQEQPFCDLHKTVERINATVARRVSRGDSLEQALDADVTIPARYRSLIISGLRQGDMDAALRGFSRVANSADESQFVSESSLLYPLIVAGLAYVGIVGFCLYFVPTLESAYVSFRLRPGAGLIVLQKLRDTLPFWIAVPPVLLVLIIFWRARRRSHGTFSVAGKIGLLAAVSGTARAMFQQRCAYFAESVAALEENNVPLEERLELAAESCGELSFAEAAGSIAANGSSDPAGSHDDAAADRFPPFMRWALTRSEPTVDRVNALRMAASLYRETSLHSMRRARIIAPIIGLVVIGGSVTLLYGLALFVPVVQMLKAVASVH